jgi:hypothetical protein
MEKIVSDNLTQVFNQIDNNLSLIEVRGLSVEILFRTRIMLKSLFEKIEKVEAEEVKE